MLSSRCLLHIQMENSRKSWIWKSGVKGEDTAGRHRATQELSCVTGSFPRTDSKAQQRKKTGFQMAAGFSYKRPPTPTPL